LVNDGAAMNPSWLAPGKVSRGLLATFFIIGGLLHFALTTTYMGIMPPRLPWHHELVLISGAAEIGGGLGMLVPGTRRAAGWGLLLLCAAVLPANVQMLLNYHAAGSAPWQQALLALHLPLQLLLMFWIWRAAASRPAANAF
jgi:uncharacterized membrane protein